ncbi:RNA polymerase II transcriptional coactivator [Drosophila mojavensis]|uniref:Transcriptional coactivator p15 (PC4) C-terminal domain-containing protein n=2 Tax=mojavensis species complex TaxID=198037 RepID=B4KGW9_DROMO|nr:RNA polymerase II transcriptional coactivator [Drosophila mojavensis]XP_017857575.1 PREDICTED: RNA polymerase II transcriptional coactivator [Drosophila arizonae]EDW11169.1 uncharacterized protein Dmoj_GI17008 [Drosophila mojavensis]
MPKIKKAERKSSSDSDSGPDDRNPPPSKKSKEGADVKSNKNDSGDGSETTTWTLEGMRQVRINEFRGRKMVDIREHYEKDGKVLPGKKGISLTLSQWKKLLAVADDVTRALEK